MERFFTGLSAKRFSLIILLELILLVGFIFVLLFYRGSYNTGAITSVRQALYSSHELAYEANHLFLLLAGIQPDRSDNAQQIHSTFETQSQRLMSALLNKDWYIEQTQASELIDRQRQQVKNTLINSLNEGRKLLAIYQSLNKLRSEGASSDSIRLMVSRFDLHRKAYVAHALKNQSAFRGFIDQLEKQHKSQVTIERRKAADTDNWILIAATFFALCQLTLCLVYHRHFDNLDHFLDRLEAIVKIGFKRNRAMSLTERLNDLTSKVQQAFDIQVIELQKQRWKNAALEAAGEAILIADQQGRIQYTNEAFTRITGYDASVVLGENCSILSSGLTSLDTYNELWNGLNQNGYWHGELTNRRKNGDIFTQMTTISALYEDNPSSESGIHQGYIAVMRDISLRKRLEQELYTLSRQDGLTGVLNRKTVLDEAEKHAQWAGRYNEALSIIVLDIDHFKAVNDRWGHPVGDRVIIAVAEHCQAILPLEGMIGRIGGEEFLLVMPGLTSCEAFKLAENLRLIIACHTLHLNHQNSVKVTCSFGISQLDLSVKNVAGRVSQAVAEADNALYEAKRAGRNCVRVFCDKITAA